jgi:uridine kinase
MAQTVAPTPEAFNKVAASLKPLLANQPKVIVGIDGRAASGKTTLATELQARFGGNLIHLDHFFLRPEQRTTERLNTPGGNIDHERFVEQVLEPLLAGVPFQYRPWNCHTEEFGDPVFVLPDRLTIIEGSYALHPGFAENFTLKVFLTISAVEQQRRLRARNPKSVAKFTDTWIPLEERYYNAYGIPSTADLQLNTETPRPAAALAAW